ncbi:hypothetical protein [Hydrocoleum sp. CS-953]|uniref:hypothetical protein n=1 Tax=Microcoleaceae TaxID=1892252 RepID=UPI000B9A7CDF|nr:hypothetical protein [Hydrocoleum sp. CS-953]OZH53823.1 hypothetical protein AFK68_15125 [Hydrocoleum sp. CS-953]
MKKAITILGISAILLSFTTIAKAQSNNPNNPETKATISGESLKTVEGRSITNDNYRTYIDEPESSNSSNQGIKPYELRRQEQNVEVIPGVSIPVNPDERQVENPLEEYTLDGDQSGKGFKLKLGI